MVVDVYTNEDTNKISCFCVCAFFLLILLNKQGPTEGASPAPCVSSTIGEGVFAGRRGLGELGRG